MLKFNYRKIGKTYYVNTNTLRKSTKHFCNRK